MLLSSLVRGLGLPATALLALGCWDASGAESALDVDALPPLSYREDLRIGSLDDPVLGFSQIGGVRVAPDGSVYVLETQAREVRVFAPDGSLLRTIGQQGQGPGEFERPIMFGLFHDTLWVQDFQLRRISWFDSEGSLLFETPMSAALEVLDTPGARISIRPGMPQADGTITSTVSYSVSGGAMAGADSVRVPRVRFDRSGAVLDTVGFDWVTGPSAQFVQLGGTIFVAQSGLLTSPRTLGDSVEIAWVRAEGAEHGTLSLTRMRSPDDTVARVAFAYPLVSTAAHLDSVVASYADRWAERYPRRDVEEAVRVTFDGEPAFHPPISTYSLDRDGSIWLRRSAATDPAAPEGTTGWILIDAEGGVRGTLRLPTSMSPSWIEGDTVWAIDRDALDVPWLVRFVIDG